MKLVVFHLLVSPSVRLVDGLLHRICDPVCIHDDQSVHISGSTSCCLGQSSSASQEALLVRIQYRYQRNCRDVKSFTKKVYSHEYVEEAVLEVLDDLDSLDRIHIRMDVTASDSHSGEILLQFFGHPLGQCGDEYSFVDFRSFADLLQKVIHLIFGRTYLDRRVKKTGRAYDLFHYKSL